MNNLHNINCYLSYIFRLGSILLNPCSKSIFFGDEKSISDSTWKFLSASVGLDIEEKIAHELPKLFQTYVCFNVADRRRMLALGTHLVVCQCIANCEGDGEPNFIIFLYNNLQFLMHWRSTNSVIAIITARLNNSAMKMSAIVYCAYLQCYFR